jgi:hypothetical protein
MCAPEYHSNIYTCGVNGDGSIEYNNIHGFSDEVSKLMPEKPIGTGMSIDEIAHWFESWDVAGNMCREK